MAQVSTLAAVLTGLVQNVNIATSDLVTNSVWVGGTGSSPSVQVTPTLLNSYLVNPMTTAGDIIYEDATPATARLPIGSTGNVLTVVGGLPSWQPPASGGTVTSVSVISANGLAGTVATSTTTPAITLSTTVTGVLQGNGTAISAATTTGTGSVVLATSPAVTGITTDTLVASGAISGSNLTSGGHALLDVALSSGNAAGGYPILDGAGKVAYAQLPSALMTFKGAWNASTNTPTLADGTGTTGDTYRASVAGTQNLGSGSQTWAVGDFNIYNGTIWQHSPAADGVSSVNGASGAVTVNAINQLTSDVTAGPASGSASAAATVAAIQGTTVSGTTGTVNVMFSASPTTTGTLTAAAINASGSLSASNFSGSSSGTNTGDQTSIPAVQQTFTSGVALTANTSYLMRMAVSGETAGRVYLADNTSAATNLKFYAIGMASGGASGVSIGGSVAVMMMGTWTLGSSDSAFISGQVGAAVWEGAAGTFTATAPSTSGTAAFKCGIVQTTTSILIDGRNLMGIN